MSSDIKQHKRDIEADRRRTLERRSPENEECVASTLLPRSAVEHPARGPKPHGRMFGYCDPESDQVVQTLSNN